MARKPRKLTKAERGRLIMQSAWPEDMLDDPEVAEFKRQLQEEEEQRRNPQPPDFSGVTGSFREAPQEEPGFLTSLDQMAQRGIDRSRDEVSNLVSNSLVGGGERSFGGGLFAATDNPIASYVGQGMQAAQMGPMGAVDFQNRLERGALDTENVNPLRDAGQAIFEEGSRRVGEGERFAKEDSLLPEWLAVGLNDVAASPSSLASLPGGAFAAIPALDVYGQEYTSGRLGGLDRETAATRAGVQAGIEGGISTIPTFGALEKFGYKMFGKDLLRSNLAKLAGRTAATGAGEAVEEMATTAAQIGADTALGALTEDQNTRKFTEQNTVDFFNQVHRAGVAGFLGGSGLAAPAHQFEVMREAGELAARAKLGNQSTRELIKVSNEEGRKAKAEREAIRLQHEQAHQLARAKAVRNAELRTFQRDLQARTEGMDPEARLQLVSEAIQQWHQENPLEGYLSTWQQRVQQPVQQQPQVVEPPVQQPPVAQPPIQEAPVQQEQAPIEPTEEGDIDVSKLKTVEQLKQELGMPAVLANASPTPNTRLTSEKALNTIINNVGSARAKSILKMVGDQKLVIVNDASELPIDKKWPTNGVAFYDGRRQYIVANRLKDNKNVLETLVSLAAHETKHAADLGGQDLTVPSQLGNFIGKKANDAIIAKVEKRAADGDATMQRLINHAKNNGVYELELPAYLISLKYDEGKNDGNTKIINDAISAVRTRYRQLTGNKEIAHEDVRYLAEKLMRTVAEHEGQLVSKKGQRVANPMIMGKSAPLFPLMKEKGLTYKSVDGNEKFIMSDKHATFNDATMNDWDSRLMDHKPVDLADIMEHDILYTQYPNAMDVKVQINDRFDSGNASWDRDTRTINISPLDLMGSRRKSLKETLMHEIQHFVQDEEGHARGGNPGLFITKEDETLYKNYTETIARLDALQKAITTKTDRAANIGVLSDKTQKLIGDIGDQYTKSNLTRLEYLGMMGDALLSDPMIGDKGKAIARQLVNTLESTKNLGTQMNKRNGERDEQYYKILGEIEARMTQDNAHLEGWEQQLTPETPEAENADLPGFDTPVDQSLIYKEVRQGKNAGAWWMEDLKGNIVAPGNTERLGIDPNTAFGSTAFSMAANRFTRPDNRATRTLNTAIKVIGGQLKTYGNLGKELGVMKEEADGEAALHSHRAMNYFVWLNRGVDRMARAGVKSGKYKTKAEGVQSIKDMINKKMDQIAALPDATRREAALAAFVRNNPELDGLRESVQEVNQLSRTLLKQLIQTHPNPTPEQLRLMNTIMENSFRYTTQMYAAFQGPAGRIHSQRLIDEHDKAQRILDKGGSLPSKLKDSFTTYKNAMSYLIKNDLAIPSRNMLDSLPTERLAMLYDTWVGDATQLRKTTKASALAQGLTNSQADQLVRDTLAGALEAKQPGVSMEDYQGKARDLMLGMLELSNEGGPFASYYRGFKQDRSILERRVGLPDEIKKLFGEITDPATRLAVTIAKQGELAARTRMLLSMRDNGTGKWVIPAHEAGLPGKEQFTATLKGENFGPLNGYRTTPEIASAINDNLEMFSTLTDALAQSYGNSQPAIEAAARATIGGVRKVAAWQKISSVVFDLYNMGTNFLGSMLAGMANGVVNPKSYWDAGKTGMDIVIDSVYTKSGHLHPRMEDAIRYGILDSARVQEIRKTPQKYVKDLISVKPKALGMAGKAIGKVGTGTIETFAMSDAWVKIAAFEDRVKNLKAYYKAEGETKTDEEIKKEAADTIKDTNITYSRTPPLVRNIESLGLTTFMPYFVSVPRAIAHNYAVGVKDLIRATNSKTAAGGMLMTMNGLRRIAGASAATYGTVIAMKALAAAVNGDDEDEAEQMKKLMYPDARFSDSFYLGKDGEGNPMFARFSRIDPFGPTTDFMRIAMDDTLKPEEKRKHMVEMFKDLVITNRVLASAAKLGIDLMVDEELKDKNTKLEKIGGATAERFKGLLESIPGMDHSDANSAIQLIDSFTPGFADMFDPKNRGVQDPKGKEEKLLSDLIMYSGGRLDVADPGLGSYRAGKEVKEARDVGKDRLAKALATGRSAEEMRDIFLDAAAKEHDAMREAAVVYEGMTKGLKLTPRQASQYLKDDANLTQSDIANIRNGRVNQELEEWLNNGTRILSKDALKKREGEGLTPDEEAQLKKTRKEFLQEMKALGYKVRENNK